MKPVYYNEFDPFAAEWLRNLIAAGLLPAGDVDDRSILDVRADDLVGYSDAHFFAGIGGWPLALRLAGFPDGTGVWTGSCPCQPLSSAGQRKGHADERHLWPAFQSLIAERGPAVVFGEQVASADGREWMSAVRADLEGMGYACGAADLCAAGIGAPTSASGSTGWPTPVAGDTKQGYSMEAGRRRAEDPDTVRMLGREVYLAGWPTPIDHDTRTGTTSRFTSLANDAKLVGWPPPKVQNARGPSIKRDGLWDMTQLVGWPTATAGDGRDYNPELVARFLQEGNIGGHGMDLDMAAALVGWATPVAHDVNSKSTFKDTLNDNIRKIAGWVTPITSDMDGGRTDLRQTFEEGGYRSCGTRREFLVCRPASGLLGRTGAAI